MNQEIIKNEFVIKIPREGMSIRVKEVDRTAMWEENMKQVNEVIHPFLKDMMCFGKPVEQIILTRSDKVEISIIKVEGLAWKWELCVFDDVKGKVTGALREDRLPGIETYETRDEVLKRAVELLIDNI
jgi:hypothetical protein